MTAEDKVQDHLTNELILTDNLILMNVLGGQDEKFGK